jgi:DNA-binding MarR family transcriptional regulator
MAKAALDNGFLESLIGYHARRAALALIERDILPMQARGLRVVGFSVLSLIARNPGVTPREVGVALAVQQPNLTPLLKQLEKLGLIERFDHPSDGRAWSLRATSEGARICAEIERDVSAAEQAATPNLTPQDRQTLLHLLQQVYRAQPRDSGKS